MNTRLLFAPIVRLLLAAILSSFATLPVLAQSVKPAKKPTLAKTQPQQAQQQQSHKLDPNNLEKDAYRIWLAYYQAQQEGRQHPLPNLKIAPTVDPKEANRAQAVWQQAQLQAKLEAQRQAAGKVQKGQPQ